MLIQSGFQGQGLLLDNSIVIRILLFMTIPIMLLIGAIYGKSVGVVSAKFNLIVTPSGILFLLMWFIIYVGLILSGIYFVINDVWSADSITIFSIVCLLNGIWMLVFKNATLTSNSVCLLLQIAMFVLNELLWISMELKVSESASSIQKWNLINRNITAFHEGWLIAAFNLNLGITLVYTFRISKKNQAILFWIICPLCFIGILILNLSFNEGFENNIGFYLSAIAAIAGALPATIKKYSMTQNELQKFAESELKQSLIHKGSYKGS